MTKPVSYCNMIATTCNINFDQQSEIQSRVYTSNQQFQKTYKNEKYYFKYPICMLKFFSYLFFIIALVSSSRMLVNSSVNLFQQIGRFISAFSIHSQIPQRVFGLIFYVNIQYHSTNSFSILSFFFHGLNCWTLLFLFQKFLVFF